MMGNYGIRAPTPRSPAPGEPCSICLAKVPAGGWSKEPIPTCRSCWPLLDWFRVLYAGLEELGLVAQFNPETRFVEDLGPDSLDHIEFLIEAEDSFGVSISDKDAEKIHTVGEFLRHIREALRRRDIKPFNPNRTEVESLWDRDLDG